MESEVHINHTDEQKTSILEQRDNERSSLIEKHEGPQTPLRYGTTDDVNVPHSYYTQKWLKQWRRRSRALRAALITALSLFNVVTLIMSNITIPMYTSAMSSDATGSDAYIAMLLGVMWTPIVLFGCSVVAWLFDRQRHTFVPRGHWGSVIKAGVAAGLQMASLAYSSPEDRTPPYLQGLLQTTFVPFAVIVRYVLLRKGITVKQGLCVIVILAGLFISLEPTVFNLDLAQQSTTVTHWYFPVLFALSWLPPAISFTYLEGAVKDGGLSSTTAVAWGFTVAFVIYALLCWTDFIPGLGMAESPAAFLSHLTRGARCFYAPGEQCAHVPVRALLFSISFALEGLTQILLVKYGEGTVYMAVTSALITPTVTIFWFLFTDVPDFHWSPHFDYSAIFVFVGLVLLVPAVGLYDYFGAEGK